MSNYCVYRYMMGNEWIYVGKAGGTLDQRIYAHSKEERFKPFLQECKISYIDFNHKSDMDHAEAALIKIQKPKLNISCKNDDVFPFLFDAESVEWKEYLTKKETLAKEREKRLRIKELNKKLKAARKTLSQYELNVNACDDWYNSYRNYVELKAKVEWSGTVITELDSACKNGKSDTVIILQKADERFVNSFDVLRRMSTSWTADENNNESIIVYAHRDNFVSIVKDITGWCYFGDCLSYKHKADEAFKKLEVTSVDAALEYRKRWTEIYDNALAIIEEAKKYGLE